MSKLFYDHLVLIEELFVEIDELDLTSEEKQSAKTMIDELLHHQLLTHILTLLPKQHQELFLTRFYEAPFAVTHITLLTELIGFDVTGEIVKKGNMLKKELRKELKKHKKKR